jgi:superfamily II DNA helicase RecQ
MLTSPGDRRMHEFFFERDYPEPRELSRVYEALAGGTMWKGSLARKLGLEDEQLDRILDKLWVHGSIRIDAEDGVQALGRDFERSYPPQRAHRGAQLEAMARYVRTRQCRMVSLIRHFGDDEDAGTACGLCDRCEPSQRALAAPPQATRRSQAARVRRQPPRARREVKVEAPSGLVDALRAFRKAEAAARAIPAFRVLTDRVLYQVAHEQPRSEAELLSITGVGPSIVRRYGERLIDLVRAHGC